LGGIVVFMAMAPGCNTARSFKERLSTATGRLTGSNFEDPMAETKMQNAEELFNSGEYKKAIEEFRALADNKGNSAILAERARFLQAECRYNLGQYPQACDTYHKVLNDFPAGVYHRDCCARMFAICDYWLDDFRYELEKRSGEQGVLRWHPKWPDWRDPTKPKVDQEGRATESLQRITTHDPKGPLAEKALFWCGYVNFVRGNFTEADNFFSQLVDTYPDSALRPQAIALAILAKNNATGGAVYDGRKCAEALRLIQIAEATIPEMANDPEMAAKLARAKFAIRSQQAEKDFLMADYYERTGHPGSAVFYYELVRRRYAGTRYSDLATERQARLITLMREGRPEPGNDPFAIAKARVKLLFRLNQPVEEQDRIRDPNIVPASGMVPQQGVTAGPRQ
jgi:outer membrane protein assembly factor BamD (BamD/ComL family)